MIIGKEGSDVYRIKPIGDKDKKHLQGAIIDFFDSMKDVEDRVNEDDVMCDEPVTFRAIVLKDKLILSAIEMDMNLELNTDNYTFHFKDIIEMCKTIRKITRD
jgi:hypothetical protein